MPPFDTPTAMPLRATGAESTHGTLELLAECEAGLQDLAGCSYNHVLHRFHRALTARLPVTPFLDTASVACSPLARQAGGTRSGCHSRRSSVSRITYWIYQVSMCWTAPPSWISSAACRHLSELAASAAAGRKESLTRFAIERLATDSAAIASSYRPEIRLSMMLLAFGCDGKSETAGAT